MTPSPVELSLAAETLPSAAALCSFCLNNAEQLFALTGRPEQHLLNSLHKWKLQKTLASSTALCRILHQNKHLPSSPCQLTQHAAGQAHELQKAPSVNLSCVGRSQVQVGEAPECKQQSAFLSARSLLTSSAGTEMLHPDKPSAGDRAPLASPPLANSHSFPLPLASHFFNTVLAGLDHGFRWHHVCTHWDTQVLMREKLTAPFAQLSPAITQH